MTEYTATTWAELKAALNSAVAQDSIVTARGDITTDATGFVQNTSNKYLKLRGHPTQGGRIIMSAMQFPGWANVGSTPAQQRAYTNNGINLRSQTIEVEDIELVGYGEQGATLKIDASGSVRNVRRVRLVDCGYKWWPYRIPSPVDAFDSVYTLGIASHGQPGTMQIEGCDFVNCAAAEWHNSHAIYADADFLRISDCLFYRCGQAISCGLPGGSQVLERINNRFVNPADAPIYAQHASIPAGVLPYCDDLTTVVKHRIMGNTYEGSFARIYSGYLSATTAIDFNDYSRATYQSFMTLLGVGDLTFAQFQATNPALDKNSKLVETRRFEQRDRWRAAMKDLRW